MVVLNNNIRGKTDGMVLNEHSIELATLLSGVGTKTVNESDQFTIGNATIDKHKGGHLIPLDKLNRELMTAFVRKSLVQEKL